MKTNVSKRDAIAQAMDWLGQLRDDDRAEPTLGGSGEPVTTPAATGPAVTTPAVTSPAVTGPAVTSPAVTGPAVTGPAVTGPAVTGPPAPAGPPVPPAPPAPPAPAGPSAPPAPPASVPAPPVPRVSDEDARDGAVIAERAPIGDELRIPIAWCDMDACISYYEHPAALGEADIRARAIAAGWRVDAVGRLACPQCQQSVPWFWTTQPVVPWDRGRAVTAAARMAAAVRAEATGSAGGTAEPGTIPAAESPPAPWPAERRDPEGSRGSDQAAGGRPDRA